MNFNMNKVWFVITVGVGVVYWNDQQMMRSKFNSSYMIITHMGNYKKC